ncbi:hypothetical protein N9N67_00700 [Bacteriovoracaceae bacterium]|nr:hypothetical protein [Bacteriovoracaceae bacterium]
MIRILDFFRNPYFRFFIIPLVFFLFYYQISADFPFWFIYDMDHITNLDLLLIHNEALPAHINHTGFGMYLLLSFAQSFAKCFHFLSHIKLDDLQQSLNPLLIVGENLDFIRGFTPVILVCTSLLMGLSIFRFQKNLSWLEQTLVMILLLTLPSLYYHSAFVRTETYALFYWSLSFFCLSLTSIKNSNNRNLILIFFSGVFVGLAFLTKLQVVFYVCLLPLILFYFKANYKYFYNINYKTEILISFLNLLLVLFYFANSWTTVIPPGFADFSAVYGLNVFGLAYLGFSFINFILNLTKNKIKLLNKFSYELSIVSLLIFGFSISFLLHLLIYDNLAASQLYLSYNFKVLFLRRNSYSQIQSLSSMIETYWDYTKVFWPWVVGSLIFVISALSLKNRDKSIYRFNVLILFAVLFLLFANTTAGTRFMLRDLIWFLPMPVLVFLMFKSKILEKMSVLRIVILLLLIGFNLKANQSMLERINLNYNQYGFNKKKILKGVYGNSRYPYEKLLIDKIGKEKDHLKDAFEQANFRQYYLNWAKRIFLNREINLSHIGIVNEGFRFHPTKREGRITYSPDELKGTMLVNFQSARNKGTKVPNSDLINEHSEYLQKFSKASSAKVSVLIPYRDTSLYVFFAEASVLHEHCNLHRTDMKIKIGNMLEVKDREVFEVKEMCLLDENVEVYGIISAKKI